MGYSNDPIRKPLRWWQAVFIFVMIAAFFLLTGLGMALFLNQITPA